MAARVDHSTLLRFVDASQLQGPDGGLEDAPLVGASGDQIGSLAGALIDPVAARVHFYVIQSPGWIGRRHYLLSMDAAPTVGHDGNALHVEMDQAGLKQCPTFVRSSIPAYSDDDLLASMFGVPRDEPSAAESLSL